MFLCNIATSSNWVAGSPISMASSPQISTNGNVTLNSAATGEQILSAGWYNVRLEANVTATGTSVGAELYTNGTAVDSTSKTITTTASDNVEIIIEYPVHVVNSTTTAQALIQFYALQAATPVNGYVTITKIQ